MAKEKQHRPRMLTYECERTNEGGVGEKDGTATADFIKDVIRDAEYVSETRGWKLRVTPQRRQRWAKNFAKMKALGVEVPFVKDHVVSSDTTLGYVTSVIPDGDKLLSGFHVRGADNIDLTRNVNRVSVFVEKDFVDGLGNHYDEAITHIALTPVPVVPNQKGFISIAASRGHAMEVPVFSLAASAGDSSMKRELLEKFRARVKAATTAAEDAVLEELDKHLTKQDEVLSATEETVELQEEEINNLQSALAAAREDQDNSTNELDENEAEERAQDILGRLEGMKKNGQLTPALAASLKPLLIGVDGARDSFMLSRVPAPNKEGFRPIRAMQILDIIDQVKPMTLGASRTRGQGTGLSREERHEQVKEFVARTQPQSVL